jgi:hypothetical protein
MVFLICINAEALTPAENPSTKDGERTMTTGNVLYLLMSIGMFAVFAAILAYYSWQQSRQGPEIVPTSSSPASHPEPQHGVMA